MQNYSQNYKSNHWIFFQLHFNIMRFDFTIYLMFFRVHRSLARIKAIFMGVFSRFSAGQRKLNNIFYCKIKMKSARKKGYGAIKYTLFNGLDPLHTLSLSFSYILVLNSSTVLILSLKQYSYRPNNIHIFTRI